MLLRLRVRGFKNLEDVTVRFGPLTCFVGPNGVGKSNLFDALQFLRLLAEHDIQEAASRVRRPMQGSHNPIDLFLGADPSARIVIEADVIVPPVVRDDFEREGRPSTTLLNYRVALRFVATPAPRLELDEESLTHHRKGDSRALIGFHHDKAFRDAVVRGVRRGGPLISTKVGGENKEIRLHQDGGSRPGRNQHLRVPDGPGGAARDALLELPPPRALGHALAGSHRGFAEGQRTRSGNGRHGGLAGPKLRHRPRCAAGGRQRPPRAELRDHRPARAQRRRTGAARARSQDPRARPLARTPVVVRRDASLPGAGRDEVEPCHGRHALHGGARERHAPEPRPGAGGPAQGLRDRSERSLRSGQPAPDVVRRLYPEEILFVDAERRLERASALVRPVANTWRSQGENTHGVPVQRVASFIGGTRLGAQWQAANSELEWQLGSVL